MSASDRETWLRLLHWDKGQTISERLAADILQLDGFHSIDPSHPLGGPDGLKDIVLVKDGCRWIAAAHFPHGQKTFAEIEQKFADDLNGVTANDSQGMAFVTNQELTLGQRAALRDRADAIRCEIYHLERLRVMLDGLSGLRIRERYLDIPATSADVLASVGHLAQLSQIIAATATTALNEELRRNVSLDLPAVGEFSFADLARIAKQQGRSEMHRAYAIDQSLLPAFANLDHPVLPIILLNDFPADLADCYSTAHEVAMVLFFLQRSIGLAHMERLNEAERSQIARVVERLWRRTVRLRPLVNKCQATLLMVGANRVTTSCSHLMIYMSACHFLQEILQVTELIGYTTVSQALGDANESDALPYDAGQIAAKWPDVVRSLRNNFTIHEGFRLVSDAFSDLSAEAVRAVRYEKGLPIVPTWMRVRGPADP